MTASPKVSIVVVSRDRDLELRRLLLSLRFLQYRNFEVVVVTGNDPRDQFPEIPFIENIKFVAFTEPNISAARNAGIRVSAGEVIAFCDDDAVPEATWLTRIVAPFANPQVGASGGYVIGRNGISFQWKARQFDRYGRDFELEVDESTASIFQGDATRGIKTEGTNCAFRKAALLAIGGFDEAFRYYLDETDVNYRMGVAGWKTAIVPDAQVHHGFAENHVREKNRIPKSLYQMGMSKAHFCRKHGENSDDADRAIQEFIVHQKKRLLNHMVQGRLEPSSVGELLETLKRGISEGKGMVARLALKPETDCPGAFRAFNTGGKTAKPVALCGRISQGAELRRKAKKLAADGVEVTLFLFSYTSVYHRLLFHEDGYWIQTGGVFGRSERSQPLFQRSTFQGRFDKEIVRLAPVRNVRSKAN